MNWYSLLEVKSLLVTICKQILLNSTSTLVSNMKNLDRNLILCPDWICVIISGQTDGMKYSAGQQKTTNLLALELDFLGEIRHRDRDQGG